MDIQQIKRMIGMTTGKHDDYLSEVVPIFVEYASDFCKNKFDVDDLPAGVKIFVAKAVEFNMKPAGLASRSMGDVSYSYDTDFPETIAKHLYPYRRAYW
ncbi:phage head-tail connector protein [Bacillus pumilus]|uniref:Phage head-tail connector protein n=1 Tax=Bacillus pumilus TaxID=1408 RepID=A0AAE4B8L0_BACPU|nr:phage head-tail connector protein [Bacillus pumilus]MDF9459360.1 phage head-tail connector protein [Bacillus pumilus]MDR4249024.1 hypothetical protein [Bacillus pumilus]